MEATAILYVGDHKEILETVVRLIHSRAGWSGEGVSDVKEAMAALRRKSYGIVLLGCGIAPQAEAALRAFITTYCHGTDIVQHYGGGSGLLFNEIEEALQRAPANG